MTRPAACLILIVAIQLVLAAFCLASFPSRTSELSPVQLVTVLVCLFTLIASALGLP